MIHLLIAIGLIATAAAYITSLPCRAFAARGRPASWSHAILGTLAAGILTVLFIYQGELFQPSRWNTAKVHTGFLIMLTFGLAVISGLVPALLVVAHYRRKLRDETRPD